MSGYGNYRILHRFPNVRIEQADMAEDGNMHMAMAMAILALEEAESDAKNSKVRYGTIGVL